MGYSKTDDIVADIYEKAIVAGLNFAISFRKKQNIFHITCAFAHSFSMECHGKKHLYKQIIPASSSIISHHKTVHRTTRDGCRWEYFPSRIWPHPYTKLDPFETYHVDMMCIPGILVGLRKVPSSRCLPAVGRMVHYPMICLLWKGFNNLLENKANATYISLWTCYELSDKCWLIFTPHISPASTIIDN